MYSTDYIIQLGPVEDDQYQYAIISDHLLVGLVVLARDPDDFKARFDAEVQTFFEDYGFTGKWRGPVPVDQSADCQYATLEE